MLLHLSLSSPSLPLFSLLPPSKGILFSCSLLSVPLSPPSKGKHYTLFVSSITAPSTSKGEIISPIIVPPISERELLSPSLSSITAHSPSLQSYNRTVHYLTHTLHIDPLRALTLNPSLRTHPLHSLQSSYSLLLSIDLSPSQISKLFTTNPKLLTHPFLPSLQFLSSILPHSSLALSISRHPRLLSSPVDTQLSPAVNFLKRLSIRVTPNTAILLATNVELTLCPKIEFFQSIGLPYNQVKSILRRFPRILTYSIEQNLKPKIGFLQNEMNLDVRKEIRRFPQYFAFNLENRIKERYFVLRENSINMGLEEMLRTSDGDFNERVLDRKLRVVDEMLRIKGLEGKF